MKSTVQKGISILLALLMLAALFVPVTAAGSYTLTIENEKSGHTYEAYQIFKGTYYYDTATETGNLSNIAWGDGVKGDDLLAALQEVAAFINCTDAESVAYVLATIEDNAAELDAFAEVVNQHLDTAKAKKEFTMSSSTTQTGVYEYKLESLTDGYYLVKDKDNTVTADSDAYTKLILKMVSDVIVKAKADVPSLEKKIVELTCETEHTHTATCYKKVDFNNAAIGDTVTYELTATIPDMDGYKEYKFQMVDTLSKGLTYQNIVSVNIAEDSLTEGTDYTVSTKAEGDKTVITITFKDFINRNKDAGKSVLVTYTATLNDEAVVGSTGNANEAYLIYSNDPQNDGSGTPDDGDGSTGKTPTDKATTYTTGLKLFKYTMKDNVKASLAGAVFQITGSKLNRARLTGEHFAEDKNGTWYKLANGTYTQTEPTEDAHKTPKYSLVEMDNYVLQAENINMTASVGADGVLVLEGLAEGTYTITEIKAPNGYNLLKDPIEVNIKWTAPKEGETACTWTATADGKDLSADETNTNVFKLEVENQAGPVLPETGGIGTRILYIAGGILLTSAVVLLLVKVLTDRKKRAN